MILCLDTGVISCWKFLLDSIFSLSFFIPLVYRDPSYIGNIKNGTELRGIFHSPLCSIIPPLLIPVPPPRSFFTVLLDIFCIHQGNTFYHGFLAMFLLGYFPILSSMNCSFWDLWRFSFSDAVKEASSYLERLPSIFLSLSRNISRSLVLSSLDFYIDSKPLAMVFITRPMGKRTRRRAAPLQTHDGCWASRKEWVCCLQGGG